MSRPFKIDISESLEELEKALKHTNSASSKERLQMLYWLKSGQVISRRLRRAQCPLGNRLQSVLDVMKQPLLDG